MLQDLVKRATGYGLVATASGALMLLAPTAAGAQDHMGMAELHGQGVVNTLGTDIRNSGIRDSTNRRGSSRTNAPSVRWPSHINNRSVASHVFTVDELNAMNSADSARASQMLSGRTIAIRGTVVRPARMKSSVQLVGRDGQGFNVSAFFARGNMPRAGSQVTLRGTVDRLRRSTMSIRNPQLASR